ncbi:MAG TPA: COX15/CtaA family protein [Bryobacteraceae bacterium]|nr:COX15/CtaA family protein [Bryobacteraceae bacterium]
MGTAVASPPRTGARHFTRYAWGVLAWNILVVLWGAYVRASGSGAGCGNHWPLCNGEVVPQAPQLKTIIEYTHRMMSGVAFFATAGLLAWSIREFPRAHRAQKWAVASFAFLIAEALLGAGLVLFQLVGSNSSAGRALYLSLHLVNTLFLLAALALTAWLSRVDAPPPRGIAPLAAWTLPLAVLIGVSGAIAALGDTLFPAASLRQGIQQDLSATAHFLLRLRVFHPALAVLGGVFFAVTAAGMLRFRNSPQLRKIALAVLLFTVMQLGAGALNLALLAPIWMQIVHLFLAELVWIALVLMAVESAAVSANN